MNRHALVARVILSAMIFWVAALAATSVAVGSAEPVDRLVEQGETALQAGDLVAAMQAFQAALEQDPDGWEIHDAMGRAWRSAGDLEASQREFRRAVTLAPSGARSATHLADLVAVLPGRRERREGWAWLANHVTDSLEVQLRVAREARRSGDLGVARVALGYALALEPDNMQACIEQIRVSRDSLDYASAEKLAKEFIRLHPRYAETYVQLGRIYQVQDRIAEASVRYQSGLELDPEHATALYRLGEIKMKQGDLEAARKLLRKAVVVASDHYQAHYLLGKVYLRLGDRDAGMRELEIFQRIKDAQRAQTRLAGGASMEPD